MYSLNCASSNTLRLNSEYVAIRLYHIVYYYINVTLYYILCDKRKKINIKEFPRTETAFHNKNQMLQIFCAGNYFGIFSHTIYQS